MNEDLNYLTELSDLEEREHYAEPGIERYIARIELYRKLKEETGCLNTELR